MLDPVYCVSHDVVFNCLHEEGLHEEDPQVRKGKPPDSL
jgi:hypothetical protein